MGPACCVYSDIIDGKQIAANIRQEIAAEVSELKSSTGKVCKFSCQLSATVMIHCTEGKGSLRHQNSHHV
jgi:hypothetical protein